MKLYHGTTAEHLPDIVRNGIRPPSATKKSNWDRTVKANKADVYLTSAYPFYFAQQAWAASKPTGKASGIVILEVAADRLDVEKLHADEDAVEQYNRGRDDLPKSWDVKRRTIYYRSRSHQYPASASLGYLGTCAYRATILTSALLRACVISDRHVARLTMQVFDPIISAANYRLFGFEYEQAVRWLFGDESECLMVKNRSFDRNLNKVELKLSREGVAVMLFSELQLLMNKTEIDTSDIPETDFTGAERGKFYRS